MLDYLSDCTCYPQHWHCYTQHSLSLSYHKRHARDQTNGKWDVKLLGVPQGLHCLYAQDLFRSRRCHIFLWGHVRDQDIYIVWNIMDEHVQFAIHTVFHKHRYAIKLHAIYDNAVVVEVVNVWGESFNRVCPIHAHIMVACDENLMFIR